MTTGFNRRDLLRGLATAGLVGTTGGLAGCGPGDGAAPKYAPYDGSGTPKRGGRIRIASMSSSSADTLDPAKGALSTDYVRHFMVYGGLTMYDTRLIPQPWLAEDISTDDRIDWIFKLRRGVTFHDGRALTSADVVFSLLRHKDPPMRPR